MIRSLTNPNQEPSAGKQTAAASTIHRLPFGF
jgi:hypothetical protein